MADALDSKSSVRKDVRVQVPPPVLLTNHSTGPRRHRVLQRVLVGERTGPTSPPATSRPIAAGPSPRPESSTCFHA